MHLAVELVGSVSGMSRLVAERRRPPTNEVSIEVTSWPPQWRLHAHKQQEGNKKRLNEKAQCVLWLHHAAKIASSEHITENNIGTTNIAD